MRIFYTSCPIIISNQIYNIYLFILKNPKGKSKNVKDNLFMKSHHNNSYYYYYITNYF